MYRNLLPPKGFTVKLMYLAAIGAACFAFLSVPAHADNVDRLSVGVGYFDVFDNEEAVDFRVDYRPGTPIIWELRPWLGAEVTSDGSLWGGAGFLYDFHLTSNWLLTPSIGAGLYSDGDGKDLGSAVEFRSMIELGYQFNNASRVSVGLSHLSNAGIGDDNPGTEILSLYYHMPISWVAGGPGADSGY
jgi:hypothetical protein